MRNASEQLNAAQVLREADPSTLLDFERFCLAMEAKVPRAGPTSHLFAKHAKTDRKTVGRKLDDEARRFEEDKELTFAPALHRNATKKLDKKRSTVDNVEDHLLTYTTKYAAQRLAREKALRDEEAAECTFQPKVTKKAADFTEYPLSRKFGTTPPVS